jgi:hypothetical protein
MFLENKPRDLLTCNRSSLNNYFTPGKARWADKETGAKYRLVKVTVGGTNANTLIAGRPCYWDSKTLGTVKTDDAGTDGTGAGVLLGGVTSGNYAWLQYAGRANVLVTNAAADLTPLVDDTANGVLKVAAGSEAAEHWGTTAEAGKNPATPLTTLVDLRLPD